MGVVSWDLFNLLFFPYLFLVAPFLYYFVTHFLFSDRRTNAWEKLFYIPFFIFLIIAIVYKAIAIATQRTANTDLFQEKLADTVDYYGDFVNIPLIMISIIASLWVIKNYEKKHLNFNSRVVKEELLWLKILLYALLLTLIPWFFYTYAYLLDETVVYLPAYVIASLLIYLIGYIGIHKINVLEQRREIRSTTKDFHNYSIEEKIKNPHVISIEKVVIGERKFLDPQFSLDMLAAELDLSKSHVSRIINTELNKSFSEYLSSLRIAEAKKHLQNPDFAQYTLVAIGLESGFNSKTTFNTTFKKHTGQTPSQFKQSNLN